MTGRRSGPRAPRAAGSPTSPRSLVPPGLKASPKRGRSRSTRSTGEAGAAARSDPRRSERSPPETRASKPPYTVYRSRPSLRDRFRKPSLESIRRESGGGGGIRGFFGRLTGGKRPWLRWILIFVGRLAAAQLHHLRDLGPDPEGQAAAVRQGRAEGRPGGAGRAEHPHPRR